MKEFELNMKKRAKRILVLDDEFNVQESLRIVLTHQGHEVITPRSPAEGINLLNEGSFDLLILDLKIPGYDGFEILESVHSKDPNIKVIIITGFGTLDVARRALSSGAQYYFDKPIDLDRFIKCIEELMGQ